MHRKKRICKAAGFLLCILLAGCREGDLSVTIQDGYTRTELMVREGQSVQSILDQAELSVDAKDQTEPSLDACIYWDHAKIRIRRHASVSVVSEEGDHIVELSGGTVQEALDQAGLKLRKNDAVNHSLMAYCVDGMQITVSHRFEIDLKADGTVRHLLSRPETVGELLEEEKVMLGTLDRVSPDLRDDLKDGMEIVVKRVEQKEVEETESIPFETETTYSQSMTAGYSRIQREGVDGQKKVTYKVTYVDGKEEKRDVIAEQVEKEAVSRLIVKGAKPKGKTVVSRERIYDCDGSGHGFDIITYSDGTVEHKDF